MALVDNLVAYYSLDNTSDATGNGYTLSNVNSVAFNAAKINNGADFGSANTNKNLNVTSNFGIAGGNITIAGWVKLNTEIASATYPLWQQGSATNNVNYFITYEFNGGTRRLIFNRQKQAVANQQTTYNITLGTSNYYHIALTYDGTNVIGYVNGVAVASVAASGNGTAAAVSRFIMGADDGQTNNDEASVILDETGVWSRALSLSEINALYNSNSGLAYPLTISSTFKSATVNAADVPATQTDFPAYVDLSRIGITTLAEAQSVRVYADSAKTTEWAREIVSATEMHVKVPSLTSTVEMFVDWDGVRADYAVTDPYGRNAVWSDYRAVYHYESLTGDSTVNAYSLTNFNSVAQSAGKLNGQAADLGASNTNKYLSIANNIGITGGNITLSGWFNQVGTKSSGTQGVYFHQGDAGTDVEYYIMAQNSGGTPQMVLFRVKQNIANNEVRFNYEPGNQGWQFWTLTYDGTNVRGYRNGAIQGTTASSGNGASAGVTGFRVGANINAVNNLASGSTDEVRVSAQVRSANWITTEYNNQNNEAGFWGTWSDVGGAIFVPKVQWLT